MDMCKRCGSNQMEIINSHSLQSGTFKVIHYCLECATSWSASTPLIWDGYKPVLAGKALL